MHKDKPPGIFDFADRPVRYAVSFGLATGFVLSIFGYGGLSLWRADSGSTEAPREGADAFVQEAARIAGRVPTPTPTPNSAVGF